MLHDIESNKEHKGRQLENFIAQDFKPGKVE